MVKSKAISLFILMVICGNASAAQTGAARESEISMPVPAEVEMIAIEVSENVSMTLDRSAGKTEVLESSGLMKNNGISMTREGTAIRIKLQASSGPDGRLKNGKTAFVRLSIPVVKVLDISGKSFVLSGMVETDALKLSGRNISVHSFKADVADTVIINADNAKLNISMRKAGKLLVSGKELYGKIVVPPSTVLALPSQTMLKVIRAAKSPR